MATVSDKKLRNANGSFNADVVSAQDYYPFGMQMPGRTMASTSYRNGFNGKENDNEVKGTGNWLDYGMRAEDPRIGRFFSVDPLTKKYPMLTPYQFASNSPLSGIDLDGLEYYYAADGTLIAKSKANNTKVHVINAEDLATVQKLLAENKIGIPTLNKLSTEVGMTNEELNTRAVLATIRYAENDGRGPLQYDAQFGMRTFKGKDLNKDETITESEKYADHPRENVTAWGLTTDVAGAYQFKSSSWDVAKRKLKLKDFSPINQDKAAIQLIKWQDQDNPRAKGVIDNIRNGKIGQVLRQLNGTWTSLPGGNEQLIWFKEAFDFFKQNVSKELNNKSDLAAPKGELKF